MQVATEAFKVSTWSLAPTVKAITIEHGWVAGIGVGTRVYSMTPEARQSRLAGARCQSTDWRVVRPKHRLRHNILANPFDQGTHPPGYLPHPLGHGGAFDVDAFAC
jgi:hypothetical protein